MREEKKLTTGEVLWIPAHTAFYAYYYDSQRKVNLSRMFTCETPRVAYYVKSAEELTQEYIAAGDDFHHWIVSKDWSVVNIPGMKEQTGGLGTFLIYNKFVKTVFTREKEDEGIVEVF